MKNDIADRSDSGEEKVPFSFSSLVHRTDLILALVILAICGSLYYVTYGFEKAAEQMSQNIPPEWFPRLLLIFIAVLTAVIPFEHLFHEKGKKALDKDRKTSVKPISIYSAVLLCAIIILMPWAGTFFSMILVCFLLPLLWGEVRLKILIPFALVFPGIVTFLFTKVLGVYFESGFWAKLF